MRKTRYFWLYMVGSWSALIGAGVIGYLFMELIHPAFGSFVTACLAFWTPYKVVEPLCEWCVNKELDMEPNQ